MNDDYLWDRGGEPDPEIERLESLLSRYRHDKPLRPPQKRPRWFALAASVILFVAVAAAVTYAFRFRWESGASWAVVVAVGAPTINGRPIDDSTRLGVGDVLETDAKSRVTVRIARIGDLEVLPSSRVRLVTTSRNRHHVYLERGNVSARVWAPPFTFAVLTPAGQANDIGCAFDLDYAEGLGAVKVTSGWVDFDGDTRSALIPAGAISELRDEPGTPFYSDASPHFIAALRRFDFDRDPNALRDVMTHARRRDAMTLLHLLERSQSYPEWRGPLFDRLAQLAPPPAGVTRADALKGDLRSIDRWRRSLGLGGVKRWWVNWRDALPER
jgi:FecR protein